jgi:hypothetical protein
MHAFPRPQQERLHVERVPAAGTCRQCGGTEIAAYRVLSEGGWWDVEKCQSCYTSLRRTRAPLLGSFTPMDSRS